MFGKYPGKFHAIFGQYIVNVLDNILTIFGRYLDYIWAIFGQYLGNINPIFMQRIYIVLDNIWTTVLVQVVAGVQNN